MSRKGKTKYSKKSKRRILLCMIASFALVLVMFATVGNAWNQIFQKYSEKKQCEKKLKNLKEEEEKLKVDVQKMQDDDYIARYAREKFFYSKDGELIIQIPKDKN